MPSRPSPRATSSSPTAITQPATAKPPALSSRRSVTTRQGVGRVAKPVAVRDTTARPDNLHATKSVKAVKQVKAVKTVLPRSTTAAAASHVTRSIKTAGQLRKTALRSYDPRDPYAVPLPSGKPSFRREDPYAGPNSPEPDDGRRGSA